MDELDFDKPFAIMIVVFYTLVTVVMGLNVYFWIGS